jgi:hypothetical protein
VSRRAITGDAGDSVEARFAAAPELPLASVGIANTETAAGRHYRVLDLPADRVDH